MDSSPNEKGKKIPKVDRKVEAWTCAGLVVCTVNYHYSKNLTSVKGSNGKRTASIESGKKEIDT